MIADDVVDLISRAIQLAEALAFEELVEARAADGWANPVLQAQNEQQGYDNQVVLGTFAEALEDLIGYDEVPVGCSDFDPEEWEEGEDSENKRKHLLRELSSAGEIGAGEPLAYVGVDSYFTLIRAGATKEQIEQAATDCLPDGE